MKKHFNDFICGVQMGGFVLRFWRWFFMSCSMVQWYDLCTAGSCGCGGICLVDL